MIQAAAYLVQGNMYLEVHVKLPQHLKADILSRVGMRTDSLFLHKQIIPLMS